MKRFIAYWRRGSEHANIVCSVVVIKDDVIFLYDAAGSPIGQFDRGFVDAWYITEASK